MQVGTDKCNNKISILNLKVNAYVVKYLLHFIFILRHDFVQFELKSYSI